MVTTVELWARVTREVCREACGAHAREELEALARYRDTLAMAATDANVAVDLGTLGDMVVVEGER